MKIFGIEIKKIPICCICKKEIASYLVFYNKRKKYCIDCFLDEEIK